MVKKTTPIVSDRALNASVALPASTGAGVTTEVDVRDALRLGEHQNDDIAGDLAAADVTRPVVAVGAIVEPVNPALASEPEVTGDLAGDAAIAEAGAAPEFRQPVAVSMETLRPDIYDVGREGNEILNTPPSTIAAEVGAGDMASLAAEREPDLIVFDLSEVLTEVDRANLQLVADHFGIVLLASGDGGTLSGSRNIDDAIDRGVTRGIQEYDENFRVRFESIADRTKAPVASLFDEDIVGAPKVSQALRAFRNKYEAGRTPYIRISSAIAGFRRGGIAHPKEQVEYRLNDFSPDELEAILTEPNLVAEII